MRVVIALCVVVMSAPALADDDVVLQREGEELAKHGRFEEAIELFKHADEIRPRASHPCLIALAYTRRELWPQAELFLSICHDRVTPTDPLPDWVPDAERLIAERLAVANVAAVTIATQPANARIAVSSFAPGEGFAGRTIHLPIGTHVIFAKADGYVDAQVTLELADRSAQHVLVAMAPVPKPLPVDASGTPGWIHDRGSPLIVASGAAFVAGIGAHLWWAYEHSQLVDATTSPLDSMKIDSYNAHSNRYDIAKYTTLGLYALGTALVAAGVYLRVTDHERATIAAMPVPGGAMVSIGWQR